MASAAAVQAGNLRMAALPGPLRFHHRVHQGLPDARMQGAYSGTFGALGGVEPYDFSLVAGILPPGLSLFANSGAVAGTPAATGRYAYRVRCRDANGSSASQSIVEEDGTLTHRVMPDLLHLSPEAYQAWADAIMPTLLEIMNQ